MDPVKDYLKIKALGVSLVAAGVFLVVYTLFWGGASGSFWMMYIGLMLVITGLGFLGINLSNYPM